MVINSSGYVSGSANGATEEADWQLFFGNFDLVIKYEANILASADYFFCPLSFSSASWPYISGDGPLFLGYLLLGWSDGSLTGKCPKCRGKVLVTSFAGSPLSGGNKWTGFCLDCRLMQKSSWESDFSERVHFVSHLRKNFPVEVAEWEEYDDYIFSWGGNGLKPARKKRLVWKQLAEPVCLEGLIQDLKTGNIKTGNPPNVCKLAGETKLRFSNRSTVLEVKMNSVSGGEEARKSGGLVRNGGQSCAAVA